MRLGIFASSLTVSGLLCVTSAFGGERQKNPSADTNENSERTILVYQTLNCFVGFPPMGDWVYKKPAAREWIKFQSSIQQFIQRSVKEKATKADIWSCDLANDCSLEFSLHKNKTVSGVKILQSSVNERFDLIVADSVKEWTQTSDFYFPRHIYKGPANMTLDVGIHERDTCTGKSVQDFLNGKCNRYNGCAGMGQEAGMLMSASERVKKQYLYTQESQDVKP